MSKARFKAELIEGHRGVTVVIVPFDPEAVWRRKHPAGLLEWLAKDRCLVTLSDGKDLRAKRAALQALLREWIRWI